jgi:hypothetical protein
MSTDKSIDILDAIYRDAALVEAEEGKATAEDRRWAKEFRGRLQLRIAERRRALLPQTSAPKKARPVRPSILAMIRDALLARIAFLTERMGDPVQFAWRHRTDLSDDDLRQILEALEDPEPTT